MRVYICNHRRLNKVARAMLSSADYELAFTLADLYILANLLHSVLIDDRPDNGIWQYHITHRQLFGLLDHLLQALVIHLVNNDGSRASGTLLSLEAKGRGNDTCRGSIKISCFIHDHRVFAAHFQDGPFQPALSLLMFCRQFIDTQANIA